MQTTHSARWVLASLLLFAGRASCQDDLEALKRSIHEAVDAGRFGEARSLIERAEAQARRDLANAQHLKEIAALEEQQRLLQEAGDADAVAMMAERIAVIRRRMAAGDGRGAGAAGSAGSPVEELRSLARRAREAGRIEEADRLDAQARIVEESATGRQMPRESPPAPIPDGPRPARPDGGGAGSSPSAGGVATLLDRMAALEEVVERLSRRLDELEQAEKK